MAGWAEAARQGSSPPPPLLMGSWTQHFAFNSMHTCFGAADTPSPADTPGPAGVLAALLLPELGRYYLLP